MFTRAVIAVLRREAAWLRVHPWERRALFALPLLWMAIVWGIFSAGATTHLPLILIDEDKGGGAREIIRLLDASRNVKVVEEYDNLSEGIAAVQRGDGFGAVYIPRHWERDMMRGDGSTVVLYANMMFSSQGGTVAGEGAKAVGEAVGRVAKQKLSALGGEAGVERVMNLVRVESRALYNPNSNYERYMVGSLLPGIMQFVLALSAICMIGREFEKKTVRAWLDAAGGNVAAALAGKLLPVFLLNATMAAMFVAWLAGWRGFAPNGSVLLWLAAFWLLLLVMVGIVLLLFGIARETERAISLAGFYSAPMLAFSGFSMPLEAMSPFGKIWAQCLPFTYFLPVQNSMWNAGTPAGDVVGNILILCGFLAGGMGGGWLLMKRLILKSAEKEAAS